MIPIYVVSMKKDEARRGVLQAAFDKLDIDFKFIDAVVGKDVSESERAKLNFSGTDSRKGRLPTDGEIGCSLSHQLIYKDIVQRDEAWSIILEDDAIIDERFNTFYRALNQQVLSQNFDTNALYLLGGQEGVAYQPKVALSRRNKIVLGNGVIFRRAIKSEGYLFRTCCYMMSKELAEKLLRLFAQDYYIADEWVYFHRLGLIEGMYLADFVGHPLELGGSHLEQERLAAIALKQPMQPDSEGFKKKIKLFLKSYFKLHLVKALLIRCRVFLYGFRYR
ncbi:glycosyltransferase family 25 protein [Serratia liquefaciens]|uniref:glycosyltransferase family 25 protein n=1 Tax=Serratia liquefaciens TaxID=614 RepID=UPI0022B82D49|nr:glycosyltransferase family 25 protein [Serratia liquefaciens]